MEEFHDWASLNYRMVNNGKYKQYTTPDGKYSFADFTAAELLTLFRNRNK